MGSKLETICAGMFWSILFGSVGGMVGGGVGAGLYGVVVGTIESGPTWGLRGGLFFGLIGAFWGSIVGLASGAFGWLPSVLFSACPRTSYLAAVILGIVLAILGCLVQGASLDSAAVAAVLLCSVPSFLASNFILRRWVLYVPDKYDF